ncbi:Sensor histidine kinase DesK [Pelagimonas phthalicica]|uniref:Sensor histidine kinase DesK n=2 Tax=Pelagimonas phthalicica TaxID=1037362 RepID=A0A238JAY6_9RHOB|nr:histidine kinase [Pelagimonas phthalicica]SMX27543.1 Sensor histidine kinase DesK [Pelagimonas phthalicica]
MLAHAIASRDAQEVGASAERTRIARDMHDNLGAQLLSALHSDRLDRKDTLIRQTISDLRDIINNNAQGGKTLGDLLADMQLEARERLALADIGLDWIEEGDANRDLPLAPNLIHSLRSILRETVSNTIRHSGAQKASIKFQLYESSLSLAHRDDGTGATPAPADPGHESGGSGLANIETRVGALGGSVSWENAATGFVIRADIPLVDMGAS